MKLKEFFEYIPKLLFILFIGIIFIVALYVNSSFFGFESMVIGTLSVILTFLTIKG